MKTINYRKERMRLLLLLDYASVAPLQRMKSVVYLTASQNSRVNNGLSSTTPYKPHRGLRRRSLWSESWSYFQ